MMNVKFAMLLVLLVHGQATYYAPGLMGRVYDYRLSTDGVQPCSECIGMVALLDPEWIGRKVWLQREGHDPVGPFLVVDCARREDRQHLISRGWAVDIDYDWAQRWHMQGPIEISVLTQRRIRLNPGYEQR